MAVEKMPLHYSFENPGSVYDEEAMTALQLAGRQGQKINEVIKAFNDLEADTGKRLKAQDDAIEIIRTSTLPAEVKAECERLINSGEFNAAINVFLGDLIGQIGTLDARLDNFLANVPEGGTSLDAEVIDIRHDYHGETHPSAGDAVRATMAKADENMDLTRKETGVWPVTEHDSFVAWVKNDGTYGLQTGDNIYHCLVTDLIPCKPGDVFEYYGCGWSAVFSWMFYNAGVYVAAETKNPGFKPGKPASVLVTVPDGVTHARFSSAAAKESEIPFRLRYRSRETLATRLDDHMKESALTLEKWGITEQAGFLYGGKSVITYATDGEYTSKSTTIIPCSPGDTFEYTGVYRGNAAAAVFLRGETPVSYLLYEGTQDITTQEIVVPDGADGVLFSSFNNVGKPVTLSVRYLGPSPLNKVRAEIGGLPTSPLYGKKYFACGDSFTASDYFDDVIESGKYKGSPKTYPYLIANRYGMDLTLDAIGGTAMAKRASRDDHFSNTRYTKIPVDVDYVTIKFGINDDNENVAVGTINDTTDTTYYGAWNIVLQWLSENRPFAKVGVLVSNGIGDQTLIEATMNVCRKWGVPFLNLAKGEDIPLMLRSARSDVCSEAKENRNRMFSVDYPSNTHPNVAAHEFESTIVGSWLETL